jgi:hypothetical protein
MLLHKVGKCNYKNIQNTQVFINISRNPWESFAELQGSGEPSLRDTGIEESDLGLVKSEVLWATSLKMDVFWDVLSFSVLDIGRGVYCLHHQGDKLRNAISTSLPD